MIYLIRNFLVVALLALVAGCGGGGGTVAGVAVVGGAGGVINIIITLLRASDGQATTTVTPSQPVKIVITTTATELLSLATTVGTLSKTAVLPVNGKAEVLLSISVNDTNDGELTITSASGTSVSKAFTVGASNLALGNLVGGVFQNAKLALGLASIAAGGTTQVTADLVDATTSLPFTEPIGIVFTSPCVASGKAVIDTPVTTVNGRASATYRDINCGQNDVLTATASVGGQALTATATLTVQPAAVGSIQFVSATPTSIALKGSGGAETSVVVFKVVNTLGIPVVGQWVDFELNTGLGGLFLDNNDATPRISSVQTDNLGQARTTVNAGTVSTTIRVTATIQGTTLSTQSNQLYVATGLPEQDRTSIAAATVNLEAFDYDGETTTVSAFLADHFGNPVPDGTTVAFRAEQGIVLPAACNTTNGTCTVTFRSQGTRPTDGRSTILATAIGEESFEDVNPSNGVFDATETLAAANDLPEAWLDANENGLRDPTEEYVDFSNPTGVVQYDVGDGKFNGSACDPLANPNCSATQRSLNVRDDIVIVWSTSTALIAFAPGSVTIPAGTKGSVAVTWSVTDLKGNPMPKGAAILLTTTNGTLTGTTSFTVPNMNSGAFTGTTTISGDGTMSAGAFTIKVTSPKGLITEASIPVND